MKKIKLLLGIIMVACCGLSAQVAITTDGSNADASAMLDVKSDSKGFLAPRMTLEQIQSIQNPADGLQVYNTDDGKIYIYVLGDIQWKEVQYGAGVINLLSSYTIGTAGSCANSIVNGIYNTNVALNISNSITLESTVTALGDWSITTNSVNGYSFSGNGTFTTTGTVQVTLYGTGTPLLSQTDNFTATANGEGGTCTFSVIVTEPVPTVYNPITGETWMDRNLGASQVATSKTDTDAYGDLYQWGRATDGHQSRVSLETGDKASTAIPNAGNSWDGLFITETADPNDWLTQQDNTLWQGVNGTNNPCPAGFRLPTEEEWSAERATWSSQDSNGAYNSPLKLVVGGFRSCNNGSFNNTDLYGYYWSRTINENNAKYQFMSSDDASMGTGHRGSGHSIRCIKN